MSHPVAFIYGPRDGEFKIVANHDEPLPIIRVKHEDGAWYRYRLTGQAEWTTPSGYPAPVYEYHCEGFDAEYTNKERYGY